MKRSDRVFSIVAAAVRALFRPFGFKNQILSQAAVAELLTPVWHQTLPSGKVLKFYAPSRTALYRGWTTLTKEPDTIAWIDGFAAGSTLYDVGANVGVFTLYAAGCGHQVVAIEPVSSNFAVLNRNIDINNFSEKAVAYCVALDRQDGLGTLFLASTTAGSSSQFERPIESARFTQGAVCLALDSLWEKGKLPFPNHLKIDVDGTEDRVIAGAQRTLADSRLQSIHIEINAVDCDKPALIAEIERFGFSATPGNRDNITFVRATR